MGESDALRLRDQAEQCAVAVKAPRPTLDDDFQALLVLAVEKLVGDGAVRCLVGQLKCFRAKPLHTDHCNETV